MGLLGVVAGWLPLFNLLFMTHILLKTFPKGHPLEGQRTNLKNLPLWFKDKKVIAFNEAVTIKKWTGNPYRSSTIGVGAFKYNYIGKDLLHLIPYLRLDEVMGWEQGTAAQIEGHLNVYCHAFTLLDIERLKNDGLIKTVNGYKYYFTEDKSVAKLCKLVGVSVEAIAFGWHLFNRENNKNL